MSRIYTVPTLDPARRLAGNGIEACTHVGEQAAEIVTRDGRKARHPSAPGMDDVCHLLFGKVLRCFYERWERW